jgi:hypothetical protein
MELWRQGTGQFWVLLPVFLLYITSLVKPISSQFTFYGADSFTSSSCSKSCSSFFWSGFCRPCKPSINSSRYSKSFSSFLWPGFCCHCKRSFTGSFCSSCLERLDNDKRSSGSINTSSRVCFYQQSCHCSWNHGFRNNSEWTCSFCWNLC